MRSNASSKLLETGSLTKVLSITNGNMMMQKMLELCDFYEELGIALLSGVEIPIESAYTDRWN